MSQNEQESPVDNFRSGRRFAFGALYLVSEVTGMSLQMFLRFDIGSRRLGSFVTLAAWLAPLVYASLTVAQPQIQYGFDRRVGYYPVGIIEPEEWKDKRNIDPRPIYVWMALFLAFWIFRRTKQLIQAGQGRYIYSHSEGRSLLFALFGGKTAKGKSDFGGKVVLEPIAAYMMCGFVAEFSIPLAKWIIISAFGSALNALIHHGANKKHAADLRDARMLSRGSHELIEGNQAAERPPLVRRASNRRKKGGDQ